MKTFTALILLATSQTVMAGVVTFDFNDLDGGAGNAAVQLYMRGEIAEQLGLPPGAYVTVTNAKANKNYTGDGHAVGPRIVGTTEDNDADPIVGNGSVPRAITLGTTDHGIFHDLPNDTFIFNAGSNTIFMTFSFPIYSVSFDYQIFPSASGSPDFTFIVDDDVDNPVLYTEGVLPITGSYPFSPNSTNTTDKVEASRQFIGQSPLFVFSQGVSKLTFVDWPERIGIDNLEINSSPVPEPTSLAIWSLLGGVVCFGISRRRHRARCR